ncbi:MAG: hypothetical protein U9R43_17210 [Thermodesulfobacteriota bacterium]|nr:hypothetical protein [Thermodesulfobacteriota bacterium]
MPIPLIWSSCQWVAITSFTPVSNGTPMLDKYSIAHGSFEEGLIHESIIIQSLKPIWTKTHSPYPGPNIDNSTSSLRGGVNICIR